MATLATWLPYLLGIAGGLCIGIPIGRIQGAERVSRGFAGPDETPTRIACGRCFADVRKCRCGKVEAA